MKRICFLPALALALAGCAGYHLGPMKPKFMADVKTIAVPVFHNDTLEERIETTMTNAVIKQFQQDGTFKIVSTDQADAVLDATIKDIKRSPSRSVRGNVLATSEFTDIVTVDFKLTKRSTGELLDHGIISGSTDFFVSGDLQQDERQAIPLLAEDVAIHLVSRLSEGW